MKKLSVQVKEKLVLLVGVLLVCCFVGCNGKKKIEETEVINRAEMASKVKSEFLHAWEGYKKYAWGMDELKPLSKTYHNWYEKPLLMTPVDAFDTMILMGLDEEVKETKELILSSLDFDRDIFVSTFETNIRFLGGLISAYQLDGDKRFLELATDLANRLLPAFTTQTGMIWAKVNLKTGAVEGEINNPAEIGTLLLEFGTLSKLTGNNVYYEKAKKALVALYDRRSELGLVGTTLNIHTGEWQDKSAHLSGCIDSYYEYLLKAWLLFGDEDCKRMWETSIAGINKYLAEDAESGFWYGHADMNAGERIHSNFGSLDAFFPAVLALGGDLERAKKLQESCYKLWTRYGIEPEQFNYKTMEVVWGPYFLRPENIESAYYLYHYTKDPKYLSMGKTYFYSLKEYCRTDEGYAELKDVVTKEKQDAMQSFFFAETLKYLYLLFAPEETLQFDQVIFNTEAHPIFKTWK